jgi:hypothetical protein
VNTTLMKMAARFMFGVDVCISHCKVRNVGLARTHRFNLLVSLLFLIGCAELSIDPSNWRPLSAQAYPFETARSQCTKAAESVPLLDKDSWNLIGALIMGLAVGAASPQAGISASTGYLEGANQSGANQLEAPSQSEVVERCMRSNGWIRQ